MPCCSDALFCPGSDYHGGLSIRLILCVVLAPKCNDISFDGNLRSILGLTCCALDRPTRVGYRLAKQATVCSLSFKHVGLPL